MSTNGFTFDFCEVRQVPMGRLKLDSRFNRDLIPWTVNAIAEDPDPNRFGVIMAAQVNGEAEYTIYDGQHRYVFLQEAGYTGEVPVMIGTVDDEHELARDFVLLNNTRRPVSPWERWKKLIYARDPGYLSMEAAVQSVGWTVGPRPLPETVVPAVVTYLHTEGGAGAIEQALALARDAWSSTPGATDTNVLKGLWRVLSHLGAQLDRDRLVERLEAVDPGDLLGAARTRKGKQGGSIPRNVEAEVARLYRRTAAPA